MNHAEFDRVDAEEISVGRIEEAVARYFDVSIEDLHSVARTPDIVLARAIAIYLSRELTSLSFPKISALIGGRTHPAAIAAVRKISKTVKTNGFVQWKTVNTAREQRLRDVLSNLRETILSNDSRRGRTGENSSPTPLWKRIRDPIHGDGMLSPLAVAVIDSPEFQRLRELKELCFAHLIYPSAVHSRFEHSIGAYLQCRRMMETIPRNHSQFGLAHPGRFVVERLQLAPECDDAARSAGRSVRAGEHMSNMEDRWNGVAEVVSVAALLHDLGHVPFSDVVDTAASDSFAEVADVRRARVRQLMFSPSSSLADVFSDEKSKWLPGMKNSDLQALMFKILHWDGSEQPRIESTGERDSKQLRPIQDGEAADQSVPSAVADSITSECFAPFMFDVVGGTLSADSLDYIARDSYHLGLPYTNDHKRLEHNLTICEASKPFEEAGPRLSVLLSRRKGRGLRGDVIENISDILRARYALWERIERHHLNVAAGAMLSKLFELAIESKVQPRIHEDIYPAPWNSSSHSACNRPHITHLSDQELLKYLARAPMRNARLRDQLAEALLFRRDRLYRVILTIDSRVIVGGRNTPKALVTALQDKRSSLRHQLEENLAAAVGRTVGDILVHCRGPEATVSVPSIWVEASEDGAIPISECQDSQMLDDEANQWVAVSEQAWCVYLVVSPDIAQDETLKVRLVRKVCEWPEVDESKVVAQVQVQ